MTDPDPLAGDGQDAWDCDHHPEWADDANRCHHPAHSFARSMKTDALARAMSCLNPYDGHPCGGCTTCLRLPAVRAAVAELQAKADELDRLREQIARALPENVRND